MAGRKLVDADLFAHIVAANNYGRMYNRNGGVYWFRDDQVGDGVWETQYAAYASNPEGRFVVHWIKAESKVFADCQPLFDDDKVFALHETEYAGQIRDAYLSGATRT